MDTFHFYLQNRLIQTSQTGGQQYSDTSPFSIPWTSTFPECKNEEKNDLKRRKSTSLKTREKKTAKEIKSSRLTVFYHLQN